MGKSLRDMPLELYRERYPALKKLDSYYGPPNGPFVSDADFEGVPPEHNVVKQNICVGGQWFHVSWYAEPNELELSDNLVDVDPGFVSEERNSVQDIRLKSDSPAFKLGFQPIPLERIGFQLDEYRKELPAGRTTPWPAAPPHDQCLVAVENPIACDKDVASRIGDASSPYCDYRFHS